MWCPWMILVVLELLELSAIFCGLVPMSIPRRVPYHQQILGGGGVEMEVNDLQMLQATLMKSKCYFSLGFVFMNRVKKKEEEVIICIKKYSSELTSTKSISSC